MPQLPAAVLVLLALGRQRGVPVQAQGEGDGVRHRAMARQAAGEEGGDRQEVSRSTLQAAAVHTGA